MVEVVGRVLTVVGAEVPALLVTSSSNTLLPFSDDVEAGGDCDVLECTEAGFVIGLMALGGIVAKCALRREKRPERAISKNSLSSSLFSPSIHSDRTGQYFCTLLFPPESEEDWIGVWDDIESNVAVLLWNPLWSVVGAELGFISIPPSAFGENLFGKLDGSWFGDPDGLVIEVFECAVEVRFRGSR